MKDLNSYLGDVYEDIARQFLIELNRRNELPFKFLKIGRWWHKEEEIDIVALNEREKTVLFFEVKWSDLTLGDVKKITDALKKKSELTRLEDYEKHYGIVAKKIEGRDKLENTLVFDLGDFDTLTI
jgi:hypothetical protein